MDTFVHRSVKTENRLIHKNTSVKFLELHLRG
jgi:hypothetical protein